MGAGVLVGRQAPLTEWRPLRRGPLSKMATADLTLSSSVPQNQRRRAKGYDGLYQVSVLAAPWVVPSARRRRRAPRVGLLAAPALAHSWACTARGARSCHRSSSPCPSGGRAGVRPGEPVTWLPPRARGRPRRWHGRVVWPQRAGVGRGQPGMASSSTALGPGRCLAPPRSLRPSKMAGWVGRTGKKEQIKENKNLET